MKLNKYIQFSQTSSPRGGIIQNIERIVLQLGTISGNFPPDYYLDHFLAKVNEAGDIVRQWIDEISDEWNKQDSNDSGDNPEVYDFTNDLQAHTLDTEIARIRKVEIHDASKAVGTGWSDLPHWFEKDRTIDLYGQDSGAPSKYFFKDGELVTDIPVDTSLIDKYRITMSRYAHEFVIGDTDAEPGIAHKPSHWLYVYLPVIDFTKDPAIEAKYRLKVYGRGDGDPESLKFLLQQFITNQNKDDVHAVKRKHFRYG